jgi:YVTN family beta-propeller protein
VRKALQRGEHLCAGSFPAFALAVVFLATLVPSAFARNAYVANNGSTSVSMIDTQTNQVVGSPFPVGNNPVGVAISPDGRFAYVTNEGSGGVSVIDTQASQLMGSPIPVGAHPGGIAITPDGRFAYVNETLAGVYVIDTQTNQVVGSLIPIGGKSNWVAISPDGRFAYVPTFGGSVYVIDTQTKQVVGSPITVGSGANGIAITPDGRFAYVANATSENVSVIDTQTDQVVGSPIPVGTSPEWIAITPDGRFAYVANATSHNVSVIDTQTNQVVGSPINVGTSPEGIAITPDGRFAYVTNEGSTIVSVIDTQTNQVVGSPITVGTGPLGVAITPDQPPLASFTDARARPGVPLAFNASASSDPDGSIARYNWDFGDGQTAADGDSTPSHTYTKPGSYQVKLTLTDNEGCSTALIFTGQTAYCNGSSSASQTQALTVAYPGVKVKCPKSAKPKGCAFKLQALSKKRKGNAESAVTEAKVKAGKSAIVSLKPKKKFRAKLAAAKKVLVRETVTIRGSKRVSFRKLKVVR